jgi:hypothetical protein
LLSLDKIYQSDSTHTMKLCNDQCNAQVFNLFINLPDRPWAPPRSRTSYVACEEFESMSIIINYNYQHDDNGKL